MLIESVKQINKSKFKVYLSGDIAFMCYKGDVSRFKLVEGTDLSESDWKVLHDEILPGRASNRVIGLLTSRDYTGKVLYDKLISDGYPSDIATKAVESVVSLGYVNDYKYASMYLHDYGKIKSLNRIIGELKKKGIDQPTLERAVSDYLEEYGDNEKEKITALLNKRHYDPSTATYEDTLKQKRYLLSKGYSYEAVNKCLGGDIDLFEDCF